MANLTYDEQARWASSDGEACLECDTETEDRPRFFVVFDGAGEERSDAAHAYFCSLTCLRKGAGKLRQAGSAALGRRLAAQS